MHLSRLHALALLLGVGGQLAVGQDAPGVTQTYTITSDSIVYVVETVYLPDTTLSLVETSAEATESSTTGSSMVQNTGVPGVVGSLTTRTPSSTPTTTRRSSTSLLPTASSVSETSVPVSSGGSSNTGAIAGGAVGGVAALGVGAALLLLRTRRKKKRSEYFTEELGRAAGYSPGVVEKEGIQHRGEEEVMSGHTMMMRRE